ncbi:hypothetical protein [Archaeoglobus sp.]
MEKTEWRMAMTVKGFRRVSVKEFEERWETSSLLECPKLRGEFGVWLYPIPEDPCKSGDCGIVTCHNYKRGFEDGSRLIVPERPLPHLLERHLEIWGGEREVD